MTARGENRDLFSGALELMILRTLARGALHGYALAQEIKTRSEDLLQIEEGSLYPALQRMLKAGWLESEMGMSARKRPVRLYRLTAAGERRLAEEMASVERMFTGLWLVLGAEKG